MQHDGGNSSSGEQTLNDVPVSGDVPSVERTSSEDTPRVEETPETTPKVKKSSEEPKDVSPATDAPPAADPEKNAVTSGPDPVDAYELSLPRDFPKWKWVCLLVVTNTLGMINGYDVSNTANIQPRLYEAFGNIKVLAWIALSYSLAFFACSTLARKILFISPIKWVWLTSMLIFIAGAAVAGSAQNMASVIIGRVVMGIGASFTQQINITYVTVYATKAENAGLFALASASWAIGLVLGGPIGSAFAENQHATWRWAFYLNIPLVGAVWILGLIVGPNLSLVPDLPLKQRLKKIDPLGIILNMSTPVLFALAATFCGPIWEWGSPASIVIWVFAGVSAICWVAQQYFCILTTPEDRAFPLHMFRHLRQIPVWVATGCGGITYAVTLYYIPLYFAFSKGDDALEQTVKTLPFILVFIFTVLFTGATLPGHGRYNVIYLVGGMLVLSAGAAMAATLDENTSASQVLGLEALIGVGLGMHFQHGIGICNVINKNQKDRVDASVIGNMTMMGGIAVFLSVAGAIYQNVGYQLLVDALGDDAAKYSEDDIREALAGTSSVIWQSGDPTVLANGISAVAEVIAKEFWIVTASGALCLVCSLCMKFEKLDYGRPKKEKKAKKGKKDVAVSEEASERTETDGKPEENTESVAANGVTSAEKAV